MPVWFKRSWKSGNYTHSSTTFSIVGSPLDGDIFTQVANLGVGYTVSIPRFLNKNVFHKAGTVCIHV